MTSADWLRNATTRLEAVGIQTARLDALILLEHIIGSTRAHILAEPDEKISDARLAKLTNLLTRRVQHVPIAYLLGKSEFYGRTFVISPHVLVPRPESEAIIDLLRVALNDSKSTQNGPKVLKIADVGTGSGALGITAKLEFPEAQVELLDVDDHALANAQTNVDLFTLQIPVIKTDFLDGSATDHDILLCNLPYVPDDYQVNQAASHEPKIALFAGPDGLDAYRTLAHQLKMVVKRPLYILCESFPAQHEALVAILAPLGYELTAEQDFVQLFKHKRS